MSGAGEGDLQELVQQAQPDVSERRLARVYAEALLNVADKQHAVEEVVAELDELLKDLTGREPYVRAFFTSGVIGKDRREGAIKAAFVDRSHPLVVNFLLVLNDHDRLMLLRPTVEQLRVLDDLRRRRFRCTVQSAVPLAEDQQQRLLEDLRKSFLLEPILEQRLDPDVLGGMVLRVADWVFDGSVRTQLVNMRKQMREMSSHEIQSGRDRFSTAAGD
jgi:F-type H+-transporting ATPase subunit delta